MLDPTLALIISIAAAIGLLAALAFSRSRARVTRAIGIRAVGEIISVEPAETDPLRRMEVEIHSDDAPPYRTVLEVAVPPEHLPDLVPGARVRLRIDRTEVDRIVIDEDWI